MDKKKLQNIIYRGVIILLTAVFVTAAVMIVQHFYQEKKSAEQFATLAECMQPQESTATTNTPAQKYASVLAENSDFIGWLKIEGTAIDYPVMQTPGNPHYYLRRGFDKKYSYYGVPYAAENCVAGTSANTIIYGHNMKNGSMFSDLEKYTSQDYYNAHKMVYFNTIKEYATYEILAIFKTTAGAADEFEYYKFTDGNAEEFYNYIDRCKALSLYDTGVTANYGDQLITLSTCEYSNKNGRLAVVAKKIWSGTEE